MKEYLKKILKKINTITIDVINFVLLLPVYFIGVGLSSLLCRFFRKKQKTKKSYWIDSEKTSKKYEEYLKQY
jgi:hypothetical protein